VVAAIQANRRVQVAQSALFVALVALQTGERGGFVTRVHGERRRSVVPILSERPAD
jgi:hypothetical protein